MKAFSSQTFQFLMENRFHNSREWFLEHKPNYMQYVLEPLQDLVAALSPTMLEIDSSLITEPKVDKTISRIYRDTRFARDKSLFKEHMWITFMRDKKSLHFDPACFFFEITPDHYHYGCGYYQASSAEMGAIRALVLENHPAFAALWRMLERQDIFVPEGESYKRNRYPEAPAELWPWLNRKNLFFTHRSTDFDLLFSEHLAERVAADFLLLKPAYEFFLAARARVKK